MTSAEESVDCAAVRHAWEQDRRRIALALHDDVVQSMSVALMAIGLVRIDEPDEPLLRDVESAISRSAGAIRTIIQALGEGLPPVG